jgi:hypothetical protein
VTLAALDSWLVKGVKLGPKYDYKVGPRCSNPECRRFAEHAHHIVRRSALAGDYAWVEIDGKVVANKTGLCVPCHNDITGEVGGHKAAIRWIDGLFVWCLVSTGGHGLGEISYHPVGPIEPQPPTPDLLAEQPGNPVESDHCPMCGQIKRRRRADATRRRRKTWIVKVPDESVEDGADVLDTLVENLALIIPNADAGMAGRYYVLVHSLAYSTMHSANFAQTLTGEGG